MAHIVEEPLEHELREQCKLAADSKEPVTMEPHQLSMLAYGYFRYREIVDELARAGCGGKYPTVVQDVSRLIGEHHALQSFAQGSQSVPLGVWEACDRALSQWTRWACALLESHDESHGDAGSPVVLQDKIGEMCGALEGGSRRFKDETTVLSDENLELHAKLRQWEQWAESVAPKCTSDHEQRESIAARLVRMRP